MSMVRYYVIHRLSGEIRMFTDLLSRANEYRWDREVPENYDIYFEVENGLDEVISL